MAESTLPRVVFVGDSLTASADWATWLPDAHIVNLAFPGYTTADARTQIPDVVAYGPDVLVLLIGTNDFGGLDREPEEVARDVLGLVAELTVALPSARVLLQSIMPRGQYWTSAISRTNALLSSAALNLGVSYLDLWPALAAADGTGLDPRYLLDDGFDVHLNDAGYAAWLGELEPALRELGRQPPNR